MANPQVENGYTRIANEILEALARVRLSAYEFNVLMVVIRRTYGFQKKTDRISLSQFATWTGIMSQHVARTIKTLVSRRILVRQQQGPQQLYYGIQKNFDLWEPLPNEVVPNEVVPNEVLPDGGIKPLPNEVGEPLPNEVDTKERRKEKRNMAKDKPSHSTDKDPRIRQFFDWWALEYERRFSASYIFTGGKEGSLVKRLLIAHDLPRLQELATRFFATPDPWVKEKGGYTLGIFASQINKLISTQPRQSRQHREMPA